MTRIKRRYLLGTVRGHWRGVDPAAVKEDEGAGGSSTRTPSPEVPVAGLLKDITTLIGEVYGDEGLGAVKGQLSLRWSSDASGAFVLRVPAAGYRRARVCCALLSNIAGVPCTAAVERATGSIEKALVKMRDLLRRRARARLRALRLATGAGAGTSLEGSEAAVLEALDADIASLKNVAGA